MEKGLLFWSKNLFYLFVLIASLGGCKKDDLESISFLPVLTTDSVNIVGILTAESGGNISSSSGSSVSARGICYSIQNNPTVGDLVITAGSGVGDFKVTINLSGLIAGEPYYVRAYATNINGTAYGNQVSFINPITTFTIGQFCLGGVVTYLDSTGQHGIIAALIDQDLDADWGCEGTQISGASGIAIGTGNQNTIDIENSCFSSFIAADVCANLIMDEYDDWYLPSKDELNQLYINRNIVGGFTEDIYWSSSENNNSNAWAQTFATGEQQPAFKSQKHFVRAVRSF